MKSLAKKIDISMDDGKDRLIQERNKVVRSLLDITAALNNVADAMVAGLMVAVISGVDNG